MVGPGRAELAAAMGPSSVVVPGILGQDRPQVPFAEDQHPVGDFGPDGENGTRSGRSWQAGVLPPRQAGVSSTSSRRHQVILTR